MHVLTVGSSVIDVFFEPGDESLFSFSGKTASFNLGDKIPIRIKRLGVGGNGANVSVALKKLGIDSTFFTFSGTDILSREIEETLIKEQVRLFKDQKDGYSDLSLICDFNADRTIFSHHEYRTHEFLYEDNTPINYIYLTSIGREWKNAYKSVLSFAKTRDVPIAFSPGSHQLAEMDETFSDTLYSSKMLLMNKDEAKRILHQFNMEENIIENMLKKLKSFGAHLVSITDGANGAYAIDGFEKMYKINPIPSDGKDKTGAGDAYAAAFLAGVLHGETTQSAMKWGVANANAVIQKTGAQNGLLTKDALNMLLSERTDLQASELI